MSAVDIKELATEKRPDSPISPHNSAFRDNTRPKTLTFYSLFFPFVFFAPVCCFTVSLKIRDTNDLRSTLVVPAGLQIGGFP